MLRRLLMLRILLMLAVNGAAEFTVLRRIGYTGIVTAIQLATAFLGVFWPDYIVELS
jgi:hypothetical protein